MSVAGCLGQGRLSNPFEEGGGAGSIRVVVQNHNYHQATIKALGQTQRRIGIVAGNSKRTFTLPWPTVDNLILEDPHQVRLCGCSYGRPNRHHHPPHRHDR